MATASEEFDFRAILNELASFAKNTGSSFRERLREVTPDESSIATAVLVAIEKEPKNLKEIAGSIALASGGTWKPGAGLVLNTISSLVDLGQAESRNEGERRIYSITASGLAALASAREARFRPEAEESSTPPAGSRSFSIGQNWQTCDPHFLKTASKLGPVLLDIAQTANRGQQEKAAVVLEEARKKLHVILAED